MTRIVFRWLVLVAPTLGCYSTSGGGNHESGGAGGFSSGASAGSGAFSSGGSSSGGAASGGSGGELCACLAIACPQVLTLQVLPDPSLGPAKLTDLQVQGDGLSMSCSPGTSACSAAYCTSSEYSIPDGHYTVTISATGFQSQTVEFDALAQTDCGCCGCCPYSYTGEVTLLSDGSPAQACGPGPSFGACLTDSAGSANCNDYCASTGQVCAVACGTEQTASREYNGNLDCSDTASTIIDSTDCNAPFVIGNALRSYQCCCALP